MKPTELLRLVWLNIGQNKFKTIMTSIGIVVGAATIVLVIAIGRGGQMDVAEQFASLNAGAIDITYEWEEEESSSGGFSPGGIISSLFSGGFMGGGQGGGNAPSGSGGGNSASMPSGGSGGDSASMPSGGSAMGQPGENSGSVERSASQGENMQGSPGGDRSGGQMPDGMENPFTGNGDGEAAEEAEESTESGSTAQERMNREKVTLTEADCEDIETFVTGIEGATISYTTKSSVEGGKISSEESYTIAGVKEDFLELSNLTLADGEFITAGDDSAKRRYCVLGSTVAAEIFGSDDAVGEQVYIDDRSYTVIGVLETSGTVASGISPDTAIFIPYETGIKYITGTSISPTLTVIATDVEHLSQVIADVKTVLSENYTDTEFTFSDAGSKMEAAQSSNTILTMLLSAAAVIVFIVGGIGIMNVLFVSVKERTNEIGILKALGASKKMILTEFLLESAAISLIGGLIGVLISFIIGPVIGHYGVRVEINAFAWMAALGFSVLAGTIFGIYPAWKASNLEPVEALNEE